jgi:hypothetical protein
MLYRHALILCTTSPVSIIGSIYKGNWIGKYAAIRILKRRGGEGQRGESLAYDLELVVVCTMQKRQPKSQGINNDQRVSTPFIFSF